MHVAEQGFAVLRAKGLLQGRRLGLSDEVFFLLGMVKSDCELAVATRRRLAGFMLQIFM